MKKATILFMLVLCHVSHAQKIWVLQSQAPRKNPDFQGILDFAEQVRVMTNHRLSIRVIAGDDKDKVAKGTGIYSAVRFNKVQMAVGWPNWWHKVDEAWNAIQSVPFGFMNFDASMMWFYAGDGIKFANQLTKKDGILWRPAWWAGMEMGLLTTTNIKKLDHLDGKTIRIGPGIPNQVLKKAVPSIRTNTIPSADIQRAFSQGRIHGIEWTVPSATSQMGFHIDKKGKPQHLIAPAVWQPSVLGDFLIHEESYRSLPQDIQSILESAMKSFSLTMTLKGKVQDMKALQNMQKQGMTISTWSHEDMKRWKNASLKVVEEHKQKSEMFKKIYQNKKKFKEMYNKYYHIYKG